MNEAITPPPEPQKQEATAEEIAVAQARMNQPYPRRFFTSEDRREMLRALEAEKGRNPTFGPDALSAFLARHRATRPARYRPADGSEITFMPDTPS
ncbi:MAG TPA: hypothetical protein VGE74_25375 [Gemmata sp.]